MRHAVEVWIVMNDSGQYVVDRDEETASERAEQEFDEHEPRRYVKLNLTLSAPRDDVVTSQVFEIPID